jgi:hypothetical protein
VVRGASGRAEGAIVEVWELKAGEGVFNLEGRSVVRGEWNREELRSDLGNEEILSNENSRGRVGNTNDVTRALHTKGSDVALGGGVTAFLFVNNKVSSRPPRSYAPTPRANALGRGLCVTPHSFRNLDSSG